VKEIVRKMAPKEPDWTFLSTLDPEELDDEKSDQVYRGIFTG
jgi:hypothetical protein